MLHDSRRRKWRTLPMAGHDRWQAIAFGDVGTFLLLVCLACATQPARAGLQAAPTQVSDSEKAQHDGEHDFDFEIGTWKTHLKRLAHPLTGSTTWVTCDGTTTVHKVWDGKANLVELEVDCPGGHVSALSLRLYNPQSRQWSLNFSNAKDGTLGQPTIGEFQNGIGEFYDQETLDSRAILVRFVIKDITPNSCRFEQAFSKDGGKTWEMNWIATDTRVNDEAHPAQ
jgi:hypothetical protein